jgi:hypothetical protein
LGERVGVRGKKQTPNEMKTLPPTFFLSGDGKGKEFPLPFGERVRVRGNKIEKAFLRLAVSTGAIA